MSIEIEIKRTMEKQRSWVILNFGSCIQIECGKQYPRFRVDDIPALIKDLQTVAKAVKDE